MGRPPGTRRKLSTNRRPIDFLREVLGRELVVIEYDVATANWLWDLLGDKSLISTTSKSLVYVMPFLMDFGFSGSLDAMFSCGRPFYAHLQKCKRLVKKTSIQFVRKIKYAWNHPSLPGWKGCGRPLEGTQYGTQLVALLQGDNLISFSNPSWHSSRLAMSFMRINSLTPQRSAGAEVSTPF
ncbi:hypothetical protein CI102_66 [Trichoderma harzianum]|nr:hypothetical protein CI102_66 [Trichoderma harzianum]